MNKDIRKLLERITNEGYEAYLVGGFVRDYLLGKKSYDLDICTNALPKEIKKIFNLKNSNGYGGYNFKQDEYDIDITTYRKELKYDNRHPIEIEYVSSLFEDIKRRDFTINTFCMDKNGNIIDLINAKSDLDNHMINIVGNPDIKFCEDPLRMVRAIRFATILDFDIEEKTYKSIIKNSEKTKSLTTKKIKEELNKILASKNYAKGLKLLKETNIYKYIDIDYDNITYTSDIIGMWAQITTKKELFTKIEKDEIKKLKNIIKTGIIDNQTLYNYGLYISSLAGEILGISRNSINNAYEKLPIKSSKDIAISTNEIIDILKIKPSKKISDIINDIEFNILTGNIENNYNTLKEYIIRKWQK